MADTALTLFVCLLVAGVIVNAVDWFANTQAQRELDEEDRRRR